VLDVVLRGGFGGRRVRAAGLRIADVGDHRRDRIVRGRHACTEPRRARRSTARGLLVCPGFVDMHTHYDGQATWDPWLTPSGWHGVTTAVMGNCGVGFAPCREEDRDWLIGVMEGVEDIPGTALSRGHPAGAGDLSPSTSTCWSARRWRSTSPNAGAARGRARLRDGA
jgi:N-acyl-D-amino-acid deacylase